MQEHAIAALPGDYIDCLPNLSDELRKTWKNEVISNVYRYIRLVTVQEEILSKFSDEGIPVVVLKGTSASCYYPKPQYRAMGDIDLLSKPEDYERACSLLLREDWMEITSKAEFERGRHRSFRKQTVTVEMHFFYAIFDDCAKAKSFDNYLFESISLQNTKLPDDINGLVLIEHIGQHMRGGIGLRQIIDWLMYADRCLRDAETLTVFQEKVERVGLSTLAKYTSGMTEMFFGTSDVISWQEQNDPKICEDFLRYVVASGNFGTSRSAFNGGAESALRYIKQPLRMLKHFQKQGEKNWKLLERRRWLTPFAWLYQMIRYVVKGLKAKPSVRRMSGGLRKIYTEFEKKKSLFETLKIQWME